MASDNRLEITWLMLASEMPVDALDRFLAITQELAPKAYPTRYGQREPFKTSVKNDGLSPFEELWRLGRVYWKGKTPITDGLYSSFRDHPLVLFPRIESVSIHRKSAGLDDAAERERLKTFVAHVGAELSAFIALVEVRGDGFSNPAVFRGGEFVGLPIGRLWLGWVDERYEPLLQDHIALVPAGSGSMFELEGAWATTAETEGHSLLGKVPEDLLIRTVSRHGVTEVVGFDEIRAGIKTVAAPMIPVSLRNGPVRYASMVWAVEPIEREPVIESLTRKGLQIERPSPDLILATLDRWTLRLSAAPAATKPGYTHMLQQMYRDPELVADMCELAPSIEDYVEVWEVSGTRDWPDMAHFNDWLIATEQLLTQHPNNVWADTASWPG